MSVADRINDTLVEALAPLRLDVLDESHRHNVPSGSESHFKLTIVSEAFADQSMVARHRSVNKLLARGIMGEAPKLDA